MLDYIFRELPTRQRKHVSFIYDDEQEDLLYSAGPQKNLS